MQGNKKHILNIVYYYEYNFYKKKVMDEYMDKNESEKNETKMGNPK